MLERMSSWQGEPTRPVDKLQALSLSTSDISRRCHRTHRNRTRPAQPQTAQGQGPVPTSTQISYLLLCTPHDMPGQGQKANCQSTLLSPPRRGLIAYGPGLHCGLGVKPPDGLNKGLCTLLFPWLPRGRACHTVCHLLIVRAIRVSWKSDTIVAAHRRLHHFYLIWQVIGSS